MFVLLYDKIGYSWYYFDVLLFFIIVFGIVVVVGDGYESDMSGFVGVLMFEDMEVVLVFIKSIWLECEVKY